MRLSVLLLGFLWSCSGTEVPKGVLNPQKMEAVLYDVIRTDEWVDFSLLQDSAFGKFSKRTALYDSVFRRHFISKEDYRNSMAFYQSRPDLLKQILDAMRIKSDTAVKKAQADTVRKARTDTLPKVQVDSLVKKDSAGRLSIKALHQLR